MTENGVLGVAHGKPFRDGMHLPKRVLDVLRLAERGLTHAQVAAELGIGVESVRTHTKIARTTLRVTTTRQASEKARFLGMFDDTADGLEARLRKGVVPDGECWRWTGEVSRKGYAQINVENKTRLAHRVAHEVWIGPIPEGYDVDHLCRVRDCINPLHLEAVTHAENVRRAAALRTHCKAGHPLSGQNIKWQSKRGSRVRSCRTCFNTKRTERRRQQREGS